MTSLFRKLKRRLSGHHQEMYKVSPSRPFLTDWEQTSKFLEMPNDILNYLLVFLSWKDLYRLALTCRRLSEIVRRYFYSISTDFAFQEAPGFELNDNGKLCRRVKPSLTSSSDSLSSSGHSGSSSSSSTTTVNSGLWRQIRGKSCFTQGTYYWSFKIQSDKADGNDWKCCVGVAAQIDDKKNPTYDRWYGGQSNAWGCQLGSSRLVSGTPSSGTIEGSELKVKCTGNGDIVSVALDMGSDQCTVAFYINHKFAGKHTFLKSNIPGGKLWPIVACSSGCHVAEVLPKHFEKNSPPTLLKVPSLKA